MRDLECGVLVIGGGAAGTRAAYEAKRAHPELEVCLAVTGSFETGGSSNVVASEALGINAPLNSQGDGDCPELYLEDMLETGGGLSDPALCRLLAEESSARIQELLALGVPFARREGHVEQQKLSGCTRARSLTCGGSTGQHIARCLKEAAQSLGVRLLEHTTLLELCRDKEGRVCGAYGRDAGGDVRIHARAVVLATGGAGSLFAVHVTPPSQTGDGWAMAYEAGCRFVNMEFFQIGPAVVHPELTFIIHSHMWRFLPRLTNRNGVAFLERYCSPDGVSVETALMEKAMSYPFSIRTASKYVDIGIFQEIAQGRGTEDGAVFLDVTHIPRERLLEKAPITYHTLRRAGIDCAKEPVKITMAVQNFNGGILIDAQGFTGVKGLYAAGEVTGGVHGSDRPGGNNLTDTQVFGYRAGRAAADYAAQVPPTAPAAGADLPRLEAGDAERALMDQSAQLYYDELTVVRTQQGLERVLKFTREHLKPGISLPLRNRLLLGQLFAQAQLARTESRGTHYRADCPDTVPEWRRRLLLQRGPDGAPALYQEGNKVT